MKHILLLVGLSIPLLVLTGCPDDHRSREEKQFAPSPEYATRFTMQCPKCKAPTKPFRINVQKTYYKCSGQSPKFPYHEEVQWDHRSEGHTPQIER